MAPITGMVLLRQALLMRVVDWWRSGLLAKILLAAVLLVLVAVLLRDHDDRTGDAATTGDTSRPGTASTTSPVAENSVAAATRRPAAAQEDPHAVAPHPVTSAQRDALPRATVGTVLDTVPADPTPTAEPSRSTLHPTTDTVVYAEPGGAGVAVLPPFQMLSATWVPVIDRRPGWALVLLPSRPHPSGAGAAGWIYLQPTVQLVDADRRVEFDTATGAVTVLAELGRADTRVTSALTGTTATASHAAAGEARGRSFVAIGATRSGALWFLRAMWPFAISEQHLCTGPIGGIAVPGLPTESLLGQLDATGCVATPPALREALADVPPGAPVLLR